MVNQRFTALIACLALVGGIAWAAALQSQEVGLAGASGIDAVLVPGAEDGADVCVFANDWSEEVDLRIGFDPDGSITLNGAVVGSTDVNHQHHVHVEIRQTPEGYEADVTVTDEDLSLVVAMESGVGLGVDAPAKARVRAQAVLELSAE